MTMNPIEGYAAYQEARKAIEAAGVDLSKLSLFAAIELVMELRNIALRHKLIAS